jgi:hypothetical protein
VTFKNKTLATFLTAALGSLGVHRFYLEGSRSWKAWAYLASFLALLGLGLRICLKDPTFGSNMPYDLFRPALLLAGLPALLAFLEAIFIALMPDHRFDDQFNAGTERQNRSGGLVVTLAALSLLVGAGLMTVMLAVDLEAAVEYFPHQPLDRSPAPH